MMHRKTKDCAEPSIRLLESFNIKWELIRNSRHARLIYYVNGKQFCQPLSNTPSDVRSRMNTRSYVLRNLRTLGVAQ